MHDHGRSEEARHHHHAGRSSEDRIDKEAVLAALDIGPGLTILDAGCGDGYMSREFAQLTGDGGKVYALDPDEHAVARLRETAAETGIEVFVGDVTVRTELPGGSLDLLYVSNVLHGFTDRQLAGFAAEARRLLKPGGRLAVVEFVKRETSSGPPLEIRLSPDDLRAAVDLAPVALVEAGPQSYLQVFRA